MDGVKIQTLSASASASISFTTGITSTYTNYVLVYDSVISNQSGSTTVQVRISSDGGTTYPSLGFLSGSNNIDYSTGAKTNSNTSAGFILYAVTLSSQPASGVLFLYNLTNNTYPTVTGIEHPI